MSSLQNNSHLSELIWSSSGKDQPSNFILYSSTQFIPNYIRQEGETAIGCLAAQKLRIGGVGFNGFSGVHEVADVSLNESQYLIVEVSEVIRGIIEEVSLGLLKRASASKMCVIFGNECGERGVRRLRAREAGCQ